MGKQKPTKWDERYQKEGHPWGDNQSPAATLLMQHLKPPANIFEIGYGYGRDLLALARAGYHVSGIDESAIGKQEAQRQFRAENLKKPTLLKGDFTKATLPADTYDGLLSHRTLHLITDRSLVVAFAQGAARILKPGGLAVISARDPRDFNPQQMAWMGDGLAKYTLPGRAGHVISFWDEGRFRDVFGQHFADFEFVQASEIEAIANPGAQSNITIMLTKKPAAPGLH